MSKPNLLRVTQMNAVYFDKEVFNTFRQHVQECIKYLPPGIVSKYDPEINFLLRLAILNYSVINHDCTFGQKLLSIKYDNISDMKKIMFVISNGFDYLREKLEIWKPSHGFNKYFYNINVFVQLLRFWNISRFLRSGEKPQLIERVLNLNHVYCRDNVQRIYEDKYMTRELIWNGFIEILVYILPLINYHKISRTLRHLNPLHKKPDVGFENSREFSVTTRCPHCEEFPVYPTHMGCNHIFCYTCLKGNQAADSKYECPKCEYYNKDILCERLLMT